MTDPLLSIADLSVSFRSSRGEEPAVRHVSFDVAAGETVALVGESGSGKSTTASAINRLLPSNGRITAGSIAFEGRELTGLRDSELRALRGRAIGLVPQDPMSNLDPLMRIGDQIAEALEVHGLAAGSTAARRAVELLDAVGIPEPERRARQHPHQLSGGMRQRVLVAIGLACRPRLLIADEPTSALDVTVQRRILDLLDELTTEIGTAVVLITHDLALAAERAQRVVVMRQGEVVESGESSRVLAEPVHEYTKRLLAAAPSLASASRVSTPVTVAVVSTGDGSALVPHPPVTHPLVTVRDVVRTFPPGFRAVDGVSFDVSAGQTVALVGESGSGKSTTANLVLALDAPTSGTVRFDGADVNAMDRRELFAFRRRVQPVFQNPYASLDPRYTVERSITEPLRVHGVGTKPERHDRAIELLERVALSQGLASRYPHELSGGQRQRVAIARALALSPELLVLDEPVSALDVIVQAQIIDLLLGLQDELGVSYLFISHDLAVVRLMSHVVHVMRDGRLVESGAPDELFRAPTHEYTRELLAAIPGRAIAPD